MSTDPVQIQDVEIAVRELGDLYRILEDKKRHLDEQSKALENTFKELDLHTRSELEGKAKEVSIYVRTVSL
jgi:hypothetical protein